MRDDELKALLRSQRERNPVPEFDRCWSDARLRAAREGSRADWRWGLGPGLVAALGAVVVALTILAPEEAPSRTPASARRLQTARTAAMAAVSAEQTLTIAEQEDEPAVAQPLALDWLLEYPGALSENGYRPADPMDFLWEGSETDFLLTMNIPAWNGAGESEVL